MGLFKKKETIPEIPSAPSLPSLSDVGENKEGNPLPELPSFPSNSKSNNINQEMVKSAVGDIPSPGENEVHTEEGEPTIPPKSSATKPIPDIPYKIKDSPPIISNPKTTQELAPPKQPLPKVHELKSDEPIFIRIDKFQSSQKHFEQIKDKIEKIESVLGKIKDVKSKEEIELKGWTEDVEQIKARLSEIDTDIFDQI